MSATQTKPAFTGTDRIISSGGVHIPGPQLPVAAPDVTRTNAEHSRLAAEAKAKERAARPAPFVLVTSAHVIKTFAKAFELNRMSRLQRLGRTNRDVAWLLDEFNQVNISGKKKPSSKRNGDTESEQTKIT